MSNSPPRIGISTDYISTKRCYSLGFDYVRAVLRAGGLPLLIPFQIPLEQIGSVLDSLDGIIISGGDDADPARWGEARHPAAVPLDPDRERFDLALLEQAQKRTMPILGICLGSQLINIQRGGSLVQYLPDIATRGSLEHRTLTDPTRHEVRLVDGSRLAGVMGCVTCSVNTRHKQAISTPGRGLKVVATATDNVIEAVEDPDYPFLLAVQWHPENLTDEPPHLRLFHALVQAAGQRG
ncbi:MAG: gamma-glutamyl-gamma-aminobutyrate hydrolase family protein [Phycisphaerales bacterium]|nr:gamma-glutamyl-gamma-aminobutyrate hydrolase family protein [Phycisphaerales bacterium]